MAARGIPVNQAEVCLRHLKLVVEERADRGAVDEGSDGARALAEFLAVCARSLTAEPGPGPGREQYSAELYQTRDVFIRAGLDALAARPWQAGNDWLQIGIHPREDLGQRGEISRRVASLARRLLSESAVDNFFFMNKPPGMRLRFQPAAAGSSADVADVLQTEVSRWQTEGLIDQIVPGVYEPERQLFGGERAMSFVHPLFTVDSLFWLDDDACRAIEGEAIGPPWLASLAVLRPVFAGLDITGWEDIGVWDGVRELAGRRLGEAKVALPQYAGIAAELRGVWSRRDQIADQLHPAVQAIVAGHDDALFAGAARWRSGYFCQPGASLGPRAAAAFYVIFHWNRAALSPVEQALIAESLAERIVDHDRG